MFPFSLFFPQFMQHATTKQASLISLIGRYDSDLCPLPVGRLRFGAVFDSATIVGEKAERGTMMLTEYVRDWSLSLLLITLAASQEEKRHPGSAQP
jgi:hypothetical protein